MFVLGCVLLMTIILLVCIILFLYGAFEQKNMQYNKIMRNFLVLYDWMEQKQKKPHALETILHEMGYNGILIYGWGYLGHLLCKELEHTQIEVKGVLDRRCLTDTYDIPSYRLQDDLPKVDAVILTVLYDGEKIRDDISKVMSCPIVSLEEIL